VEVRVANSGGPQAASVRMTVHDPRGRPIAARTAPAQDLATGETGTYACQIPIAEPALWSPERPDLYRGATAILVAGRVGDAVTTTFGIRSLVFNAADGFLLNGKPLKMLGGNVHHDHGPLGAVAIGRAEERTVEILKAAGFNTIRTSHNPPSPSLLDACDRL